jgi:hypothetical protein
VNAKDFARAAAIPGAVGVVAFVVYACTLYPDVAGGDSGELVGAVMTGGVIHPPGYPLYALLGRVFEWLPAGNPAWRLNLLSAACDAGAAALLYAAVARWSRSRAAGLTSAALFAFAPLVWRYAICAEVFALNNLACAALLSCAVLYDEARNRRWLWLGAFVFGLGLSDHHTVVFTAVPLTLWALWRGGRQLLGGKTLLWAVLAFAAGLLPYLYLPIAARHHAPVSWGEADTWSGFWTHVLRREYGTFHLAPEGVASGASGEATARAFFEALFEPLSYLGVVVALVGVFACVRSARRKPLAVVLFAPPLLSLVVFAWLGNLPVTDPLHREIVARFWQQPLLYATAFAGLGVAYLVQRTGVKPLGGVAAALALVAGLIRYGSMDRHTSRLVRSYGAEILRAAPPGALLLTRGDVITNTVRYPQLAEGVRPDVRVVDQELLGFVWYAREEATRGVLVLPGPRYMPGAPGGFTMKELLDANAARGPVLLCSGAKAGDTSADATYGRWPFGLCELVHRGDQPVSLDEWIAASGEALPHIDFTGQPHPSGSWEDVVWKDTWEVRQTRAAHLLQVAGADPSRRRYIAAAAQMLEELVHENPAMPGHVYKNLAIALGRAGLETPEQRAQAAAAWRKYLETAPKDDPYTKAIEKEVQRLEAAP